jgi:hypothetical protein
MWYVYTNVFLTLYVGASANACIFHVRTLMCASRGCIMCSPRRYSTLFGASKVCVGAGTNVFCSFVLLAGFFEVVRIIVFLFALYFFPSVVLKVKIAIITLKFIKIDLLYIVCLHFMVPSKLQLLPKWPHLVPLDFEKTLVQPITVTLA